MSSKTYVIVEDNYDLSGDFMHFKGYKVIYAGTEQATAFNIFNNLSFGNLTAFKEGTIIEKRTRRNGRLLNEGLLKTK